MRSGSLNEMVEYRKPFNSGQAGLHRTSPRAVRPEADGMGGLQHRFNSVKVRSYGDA